MRSRELASGLQKLRALIDRVDEACGDSIEMRSEWAKYVCVRAAGFLETALREVFGGFVRNSASEAVERFAVSELKKVNNPKMGRFLDVAGAFKKTWREELEEFAADEGRGDAINSIMANRNRIAHGDDSGITIVRVKDYLKKSVDVVEFLENLVRP